MKLACLFSGGKDSTYALHKAQQDKDHKVECLITLKSKNEDSYMFHTPNINLTELQAKALSLPLITQTTSGEKEGELSDLKKAIEQAKKKYKIEGIVTGAISSTYQASRIQTICNELNIYCFNPLWQKNQNDYMEELLNSKFKIMIVAIAAYGLDKAWLGRVLTKEDITKLKEKQESLSINPAGEGGEYESLVTDAPHFKKRITITKATVTMEDENTGKYIIEEAQIE